MKGEVAHLPTVWVLSRRRKPLTPAPPRWMLGADSLHAGLRAPEPTLSRRERVGPCRFPCCVLAFASSPPSPSPEQRGGRVFPEFLSPRRRLLSDVGGRAAS